MSLKFNYEQEQEQYFKEDFLKLDNIERLKKLIDIYLPDHDSLLKSFIGENVLKDKTNSNKLGTVSKNDVFGLGVDGIDLNTTELNTYENSLIEKLAIIFYSSREFTKINFNLKNKLNSLNKAEKDAKVILANFIVQPVKRVITFSKLIPDFNKLSINDQVCLLQGSIMEIIICSSASLYDSVNNKLTNFISKDHNIKGPDSSSIQLDLLKCFWSEDVFEKTLSFLKTMSELKLDESSLIIFLTLILFSPDRRDLKDREKILSIQSKYSHLLKKYMFRKYGFGQNTIKTYNKLLLKLMELRTLQEIHSSMLYDVDLNLLEPFSLALISNSKEEAMKIQI